jgi:hypothetical protein
MSGLTQQDVRILTHYARAGNRELYWNYLAQKEGADGYGLLALGVVRNDSMPGAVANHFAANSAFRTGRVLSERDWERFGEELVRRDLARRAEHLGNGRADLALNLPVDDVQRAHDDAFEQKQIDPNAWTPRQLLEAARRHGGTEAAEQVWANMLDSRGLGLNRMGITSRDVLHTYNDAQLAATRYLGAMTLAAITASGDRARTDPDIIGARDFYYVYDRRTGGWSSVSSGGGGLGGPMIREVTDARQLRELDDTRAVRLESQAQRDDWHPQDPNRTRPIARSPFTLADAGTAPDADVRLASARDEGAAPSGRGDAQAALEDSLLYRQALTAMSRRDAELGREPDDDTRRIALAGATLAARSGYARIDDIVFNVQTDRLAAGERFFVLQGGREDPAHLRESMLTREALAMAPEQAQRELAQLEQAAARTREAHSDDRQRQPAGPQVA